jgi:hypothetical protein
MRVQVKGPENRDLRIVSLLSDFVDIGHAEYD